jgi:hypothetical protein
VPSAFIAKQQITRWSPSLSKYLPLLLTYALHIYTSRSFMSQKNAIFQLAHIHIFTLQHNKLLFPSHACTSVRITHPSRFTPPFHTPIPPFFHSPTSINHTTTKKCTKLASTSLYTSAFTSGSASASAALVFDYITQATAFSSRTT